MRKLLLSSKKRTPLTTFWLVRYSFLCDYYFWNFQNVQLSRLKFLTLGKKDVQNFRKIINIIFVIFHTHLIINKLTYTFFSQATRPSSDDIDIKNYIILRFFSKCFPYFLLKVFSILLNDDDCHKMAGIWPKVT